MNEKDIKNRLGVSERETAKMVYGWNICNSERKLQRMGTLKMSL